MNTGQMLLILGAMALLSVTMLSVNRVLVEHGEASVEGVSRLGATSLAQGLIEEAIGKGFDEVVLSDPPTPLPASFTPAGSLGPETGESYPNYDDIDDFNGITRTDTTEAGVVYTIQAEVEYVDASNPDGPAEALPTFFKRLKVTVSSPYLSNDTALYYLAGYWGN